MLFTSEKTGIAISWFVELVFVLFFVGVVMYKITCSWIKRQGAPNVS